MSEQHQHLCHLCGLDWDCVGPCRGVITKPHVACPPQRAEHELVRQAARLAIAANRAALEELGEMDVPAALTEEEKPVLAEVWGNEADKVFDERG